MLQRVLGVVVTLARAVPPRLTGEDSDEKATLGAGVGVEVGVGVFVGVGVVVGVLVGIGM